MKKTSKVPAVLMMTFFTVIAIITLIPIVLLLLSSLRSGSDLMRYGLNFNINWSEASFANYKLLFSGGNSYFIWYKNSLIITVIHVALSLGLSSCVGYAFAVYNFKYKNAFFICVLLVMMVPGEITMLPLYRLIAKMRLIDNMWGIILPGLVVPMLIFFFRQYASGIPRDFLDAGRVDGCTEYGIFARIMVPVMKPAFAAMGIYQGMGSWNNFLWPMIVIRANEKITLPVGIQSLVTPYGNNYDLLVAGSCFAILPILILFACFQQYFIAGMTAGAVKG